MRQTHMNQSMTISEPAPFNEPFDPIRATQSGTLYASYTWLREVAPSPYCPQAGTYIFSRYEDVEEIQHSRALARGNAEYVRSLFGDTRLSLVFQSIFQTDGAVHDRLHAAVQAPFAKKAIQPLRPTIRRICEQVLDAFDPQKDTFDIQGNYADIVPLAVICHVLGVPSKDYAVFRQKTREFWPALDILTMRHLYTEEEAAAITAMATQATNFLGDYVQAELSCAWRERSVRQDVIGHLVSSGLSGQEAVPLCIDLLIAGHETAAYGFGSLVYLSLLYPEYFGVDPIEEDVIWEGLRLYSPTQTAVRYAAQSARIGKIPIEPGSHILGLIGAANRDPRIFRNPDQFDPGRSNVRQALVFGRGSFFCIGAPLIIVEFQEVK